MKSAMRERRCYRASQESTEITVQAALPRLSAAAWTGRRASKLHGRANDEPVARFFVEQVPSTPAHWKERAAQSNPYASRAVSAGLVHVL
jgi:hypothetical protein